MSKPALAFAPDFYTQLVLSAAVTATRYPAALLTLDAQLEDDLGIDSVKLAEIVALVGKELGLSPGAAPTRRRARTLRELAGLAQEWVGEAAPVPSGPTPDPQVVPTVITAPSPMTAAPLLVAAPVAPARAVPVESQIRAIFARITRYPESLLTAHADLEDELGIDSVKQAEIVAAVVQELQVDPVALRARRARTLSAVVQAVQELLPAPVPASTPAVVATAPRPVAAPSLPSPAAPSAPAPSAVARPLTGFEGKVVLVTGSGRGIGRVMVERLARLGATVVVNSFHSREQGEAVARGIVDSGGKAVHLWGSVTHEGQLDEMFAQIDQRFGGLDLLVCNASNGIIGRFDQITPRDWDRAFRTCVTGTHACVLRAAPLMARRGGGSVVTMSTSMSQRYCAGLGSQGVVKAAVESLTRYLAAELAPQRVRVNCLSAGPVYGELLDQWENAEARIARWEEATPGGELCSADDVADVAEFLLSNRAARVNGAVWVVDNGLTNMVDGVRMSPVAGPRDRVAVREGLNGHQA